MAIENDQIASLRELETRLREALVAAETPHDAGRFRVLLEEVQERLREAGQKINDE
ncbi:MAG TPA: hypothetical protein VGL89_16710 [Candidatus Koribacter sp.]|jgi:hypothetical protein